MRLMCAGSTTDGSITARTLLMQSGTPQATVLDSANDKKMEMDADSTSN
jgi:hypothetical protein